MRERLDSEWDYFANSGITPAYAGKTVIFKPGFALQEDHPRVCGKDRG